MEKQNNLSKKMSESCLSKKSDKSNKSDDFVDVPINSPRLSEESNVSKNKKYKWFYCLFLCWKKNKV